MGIEKKRKRKKNPKPQTKQHHPPPPNKELLLVGNTSLVFMQSGVWHVGGSGQGSRETSHGIQFGEFLAG